MESKIFKGFLVLSLVVLLLLIGVYWFRLSGDSEAAVKKKLNAFPAELDFSDSDGVIREFIPKTDTK